VSHWVRLGGPMGAIIVKRGRAKPLWRGHPWVFADSIDQLEGAPEAGDLVAVRDSGGRTIGHGYYSPGSAIAVRILGPEPEDDATLFASRIEQAVRLRLDVLGLPVVTDAYRVVHSEADGLPGLVVDHFAGVLVVQFSTVGMHLRREAILDALEEALRPTAILEQPDRRVCAIEGIPAEPGILRGAMPAEPPFILENGVCFRIGFGAGAMQKTGFYSDQRDNRQAVARLARDRTVLDLFAYTGGFGLYAAVNGAVDVLGIDASGAALALAAENAMLNHVPRVRFERKDVRKALNELHASGRRFDIVICDPPKYARDRKGVKKALRAYRDLHLRALRLVTPGGVLAASSCSGLVTEDEFERTLREAAYDLGRPLQLLQRGGQAADHPVLATCPEGRYLKFLLVCAP